MDAFIGTLPLTIAICISECLNESWGIFKADWNSGGAGAAYERNAISSYKTYKSKKCAQIMSVFDKV
jgi:hypothetical protein